MTDTTAQSPHTKGPHTQGPRPVAIGLRLLRSWQRLSPLPGGRWLFSRVLGLLVPYTGSIGAVVQILEPGHSQVRLPDRRRVRNHLNSIHAIALANVAELSTGLAVLSGLPEGFNGILVGIDVSYVKKARGALIAECHCNIAPFTERQEVPVTTEIRDASGEVVTTAVVRWLIGPNSSSG